MARAPRKPRAPRKSPAELDPAERGERARGAALRLLAVRERSAAEIRQRLRQRGFDADTIASVLGDLVDQGLQDDRRFATAAAESGAARGLSSRAIQDRLRRSGVDRELAAAASAESPEAEEARARSVAERRAARLGDIPREVRFRRLSTYLGRQGYPADLCLRLAHELADPGIPGEHPCPPQGSY